MDKTPTNKVKTIRGTYTSRCPVPLRVYVRVLSLLSLFEFKQCIYVMLKKFFVCSVLAVDNVYFFHNKVGYGDSLGRAGSGRRLHRDVHRPRCARWRGGDLGRAVDRGSPMRR